MSLEAQLSKQEEHSFVIITIISAANLIPNLLDLSID